jgi:hypothetical protein
MAKRKPTITPRKPPPAARPEAVAAFVERGEPEPSRPKGGSQKAKRSKPSDLQRPRSENVYLPERKRGWLAGEAPRRCTLYLPQELFEELRRRCFEQGIELSAFVTEAVRVALAARRT